MDTSGGIKYYTQQEINKEKWDACIAKASNRLIYGYSFYLDHMARHWDALVLDDYAAVMPLTWNRKFGIRYLYQPFLCASLGVFGQSLPIAVIRKFLLRIPAAFRYVDISLNHENLCLLHDAGMKERKNFVLNLQQPYELLYQHFSDNVKRNIKKSLQQGCTVTRPAFADIFRLAKTLLEKVVTATQEDYSRFAALYNYLEQKKTTFNYGIADANGNLLASCVFLLSQNRAYYILVGNHPDGKTTGASHALINAFIKDHAGKNIVLDFEGSDVPGLAAFYSSFGAVAENYPAVKYNRLPALVKWMKP